MSQIRMAPTGNCTVLLLGWAIALTGLTAVVPAAAQAIPPTFFAVSPWYPSASAPDFPTVTFGFLGHAQWPWAEIEPCSGCFKGTCRPRKNAPPATCGFDLLDKYVEDAMNHNLWWGKANNTVAVAVTLGMTPDWATSNHQNCINTSHPGVTQCPAPPNLKAWKTFITALTSRYNGTTMPRIAIYELWNEADDSKWWTGTPSEMVRLGRAAHRIIHGQHPHSMLLTPSVAGKNSVTWMQSYLAAGGDQFADGGAFHGYIAPTGFTDPNTNAYPMPEDAAGFGSVSSIASSMRQVFDASKLAGKPMFQTEGSWGKDNIPIPPSSNSAVQVAWLAWYYLLLAGLSSSLNLQLVDWFAWNGVPPGKPNTWGAIKGSEAATAYTEVEKWLVGATFMQPCSGPDPQGTRWCNLTRRDGAWVQAVWNTNGLTRYSQDEHFTRYRSLDGTSTKIGASTIGIGIEPILLEGP